jgi:hypothetical protein
MNAPNKVFFRRGNNDNCLFSAVSVTYMFEVASKFPLVAELGPDKLGEAVVVTAGQTTASKAPPQPKAAPADKPINPALAQDAKLFQIRKFDFAKTLTQVEAERTLPASRARIYVVKAVEGWNTRAWQGGAPFPEFAVQDIPWMYHLAVFDIVRIHYSKTGVGQGHWTIVNGFRYLKDKTLLEQLLGGPANFAKLDDYVRDLDFRGRWKKAAGGAGGFDCSPKEAPAPFTIVRVKSLSDTLTTPLSEMSQALP